jgi:hypothetical protein
VREGNYFNTIVRSTGGGLGRRKTGWMKTAVTKM